MTETAAAAQAAAAADRKKAALSGKGRRRFHVCGKPTENAGFVALGKKSGKIQISSCQRGRSVVF